ncbi:MAG: zinc-ribbon domain-containing protein [Desulfuromonadales bacterium]|nr:zinc-ribbon domain-containing protein [Desulfuromonadales bacterium]
MVIQCSSCNTRFKIADDKVKPGGVKVRCSKCKEVFTVLPPEEEHTAAATAATSLDDVDWGSLNSDKSADDSTEEPSMPEFSFADEEASPAADDDLAFDTSADTSEEADDSFSFGDEESSEEDELFSFGGSSEPSTDDFSFDEPVGEGAQDEFSFDAAPAATGTADDFDWDGSSSDDTDSQDDYSFGETAETDDNLDFSSLEMATDEPEAVEVEAEEPRRQEMIPSAENSRPAIVKGPQNSRAGGRSTGKSRTTKKKSGPLRGIFVLFLLLLLIVGGGLFGLKQMGFWSGNFEELQRVDYVTAAKTVWEKGMTEVNRLVGNAVSQQPIGMITVTTMTGKYSQNISAGTLFVIDGTIRNDYNANRSAVVVQGVLYDEADAVVRQKKVYCGNVIDSGMLQTGTVAAMDKLSANVFGDKFSNEDIAPGATVPFTIVFHDLPDNLAQYNVEIVESATGTKR